MQDRTWSPNHGILFSGTWSPNHGIVFGSATGTHRSLSTSAVERIQPDQWSHSVAEDNYVMASAAPNALECQSTASERAAGSAEPDGRSASVPASTKPEEPIEPEPVDPAQDELPETTTSFKMTEELFRAAKTAEPKSKEWYWSHKLYRGPPDEKGESHEPKVHYCKTIQTTEQVLAKHFKDSKVLGFDIEWRENAYRTSDAKQNVSLIQIANEERIALFHIACYPKNQLVPPTLKKIMEDPSVTKVGVSIKADCTRLRTHMSIDCRGIFELSHLYRLVKFSHSKEYGSINRRLVSLATQTQEHLHLPMYKGEVRVSDWSRSLKTEQIYYAANDSYAGLQLYHTLEMKRKELNPCPPRPYHAELNLPIRFAEGLEIPSEGEDAEVEDAEPKEAKVTKSKNGKKSKADVIVDSDGVLREDVDMDGMATRVTECGEGGDNADGIGAQK